MSDNKKELVLADVVPGVRLTANITPLDYQQIGKLVNIAAELDPTVADRRHNGRWLAIDVDKSAFASEAYANLKDAYGQMAPDKRISSYGAAKVFLTKEITNSNDVIAAGVILSDSFHESNIAYIGTDKESKYQLGRSIRPLVIDEDGFLVNESFVGRFVIRAFAITKFVEKEPGIFWPFIRFETVSLFAKRDKEGNIESVSRSRVEVSEHCESWDKVFRHFVAAPTTYEFLKSLAQALNIEDKVTLPDPSSFKRKDQKFQKRPQQNGKTQGRSQNENEQPQEDLVDEQIEETDTQQDVEIVESN